jgi:leucyl-tRNA synthetase
MNALFTRIFGVFRAFLFFSNCKTRELVFKRQAVQAAMGDKPVQKIIMVPKKLINIVV